MIFHSWFAFDASLVQWMDDCFVGGCSQWCSCHGFGCFANDLHTYTQLLDVYELVVDTVNVVVVVVVFFLRHFSISSKCFVWEDIGK